MASSPNGLARLWKWLRKTLAALTQNNLAQQGDYSPYEKRVARLILIYLVIAYTVAIAIMADAFHGGSRTLDFFMSLGSWAAATPAAATPVSTPSPKLEDGVQGIGALVASSNLTPVPTPAPTSTPNSDDNPSPTETADTLVVLAASAGLFGATIAAMRSLYERYAFSVENAPEKFSTQWSMRWFLGPFMGGGLALMVFAIVQSGVLPFAIGSYAPNNVSDETVKSEFAAIGFGALVGLGAKDVIEKLIQSLKSGLGMENPEDKALRVFAETDHLEFGGKTIRFSVKPYMPVTWTVEPTNMGSITNGVFRSLDKAPENIPESLDVVVTATSKSDAGQSASATLTLKKPAGA